jgi:WD40 repeat protein
VVSNDRLLALGQSTAVEYSRLESPTVGKTWWAREFVNDLAVVPGTGAALVALDGSLVDVRPGGDRLARSWRPPVPADQVKSWQLRDLAVSQDGQRVAVHRMKPVTRAGTSEDCIDLVDLRSERTLATASLGGPQPYGYGSWRLAFSPDGRRLAVGTGSGAVAVVDAESGAVLLPPQQVEASRWRIGVLEWSADGTALLVGGGDGVLRTLSAESGAVTRSVEPFTGLVLTSSAVVAGGSLLAIASSSGEVAFLDAFTLQEVGPRLSAGGVALQDVAVSPDGAEVAAIGFDGAVRLWSRRSGRAIGPAMKSHLGVGFAVAFAADGKRLWTVGQDSAVSAWDLEPGRWLVRACELAGRNLTAEEWRQYLPERPHRQTCPQFPSA